MCAPWRMIWVKPWVVRVTWLAAQDQSGEFALRDAVQLRKLEEAFDYGDWYKYLIPAAEALADCLS